MLIFHSFTSQELGLQHLCEIQKLTNLTSIPILVPQSLY